MKRVRALAPVSVALTYGLVSGCGAHAGSPDLPQGPPDAAVLGGGDGPEPSDASLAGDGRVVPSFGSTQTQAVAPPPVSGGTLLVSRDGTTAVVADADRDLVYLVDLAAASLTTLPLQAGDEPGRLAEDASGRVHVAARRGGVIVTVDVANKKIVGRRAVCAAPRGVAYDLAADALYVACATGELVTLPAAGGAPTRTVVVDRDLRDVIVGPPGSDTPVYVTRLKTAELLWLAKDGSVQTRQVAPTSISMAPGTAWRAIPTAAGDIAMVHQRATVEVVGTGAGGYGGGETAGCKSSIVESTVSFFKAGAPVTVPAPVIPAAVLPVDVAESADGMTLAVVAAGNAYVPEGSVYLLDEAVVANPPIEGPPGGGNCAPVLPLRPQGQAVAAAFTPSKKLLVQTRAPSTLYVYDLSSGVLPVATIPLSTPERDDTGHAIFHSNSGAFLACASCHPEGLEDGRVWNLDTAGPVRTQSLSGTLAGTAPYHWEGDLGSVTALMQEVFVQRMSGPKLSPDQVAAVQAWLFALPAPPASASSAAAVRGQALFQSAAVGCSTCHSGPMLTNNATLDVNTGGSFQVPSLVGVGWRSPFLHDGCANTLTQRFATSCTDGVSHGHTANLGATQIADLVAFLGTL